MYQKIQFPTKEEYPEYAEMYMKWVKKDDSLLTQLETGLKNSLSIVDSLTNEQLDYRYAPDKWSIKEVLVHIIDDERIYGYRAMCFARNDKSELPGFEQDDYIVYSDTSQRNMATIMEEYKAVRNATIALFNGFSQKALLRIGKANMNRTSVRALGYHILGHELHHMNMVQNIYLKHY